jgi:transcriptional regulator with XRE-family HTH domain
MAIRPGDSRLHTILREKNLTLSALAKLTGIRLTQLSDYAHNRRKMSLANAATIGAALGVPIEDLSEWDEY